MNRKILIYSSIVALLVSIVSPLSDRASAVSGYDKAYNTVDHVGIQAVNAGYKGNVNSPFLDLTDKWQGIMNNLHSGDYNFIKSNDDTAANSATAFSNIFSDAMDHGFVAVSQHVVWWNNTSENPDLSFTVYFSTSTNLTLKFGDSPFAPAKSLYITSKNTSDDKPIVYSATFSYLTGSNVDHSKVYIVPHVDYQYWLNSYGEISNDYNSLNNSYPVTSSYCYNNGYNCQSSANLFARGITIDSNTIPQGYNGKELNTVIPTSDSPECTEYGLCDQNVVYEDCSDSILDFFGVFKCYARNVGTFFNNFGKITLQTITKIFNNILSKFKLFFSILFLPLELIIKLFNAIVITNIGSGNYSCAGNPYPTHCVWIATWNPSGLLNFNGQMRIDWGTFEKNYKLLFDWTRGIAQAMLIFVTLLMLDRKRKEYIH